MRIGIYGGTFNPIHNGHLKLAELAYRGCGLDKVVFMPSGSSYLKDHVLSADLRYQMVLLAIEGIGYYAASDMEIRREGPTYSYETFEQLHREHPEDDFFFIMGEDSLRYIEYWKEPDRLMRQCSLIVGTRKEENVTVENPDHDDGKTEIFTDAGVDAERLNLEQYAAYLEKRYHTEIICIRMNDDNSSSKIRQFVKDGKEISRMVPDKVKDFIIKRGLYKNFLY